MQSEKKDEEHFSWPTDYWPRWKRFIYPEFYFVLSWMHMEMNKKKQNTKYTINFLLHHPPIRSISQQSGKESKHQKEDWDVGIMLGKFHFA